MHPGACSRSRTVAAALAAILVGGASPTVARADLEGDKFRSDPWHVSLTTPRNWQASDQSSYPNILVLMVATSPRGKMLLSAERLDRVRDAETYARNTAAILGKLGFTVGVPRAHPTGAFWLEYDNGKAFLRQAFVVADGYGYSLTLSADDVHGRTQHLRAFDATLRSLRPDRLGPTAPAVPPSPPGTPPGTPPKAEPEPDKPVTTPEAAAPKSGATTP
jgi:hypothetical protein